MVPVFSYTKVGKEPNKTGTGRLNNGVAQVPPTRGTSDLDAFRESLPIHKLNEDIIHCINHNRVVLISGETGSGKTTQVGVSEQRYRLVVHNMKLHKWLILK